MPTLVFVLGTVVSLWLRFVLRDIESGDAIFFLLPWYEEIAAHGLYEQVGDYNLVYQFFIWLMTKMPFFPPLYAFKLLSCLFDYALASFALAWRMRLRPKTGAGKGS